MRSLRDLLNIIERIDKCGAGFRSLGEDLDTTSSAGRAMMQMVGVFAEFERLIIRERTKAGLAEARKPDANSDAASSSPKWIASKLSIWCARAR